MPTDIYSVACVREFDRAAIEAEGIAGYTLMTRAGSAAVRMARQAFAQARHWQVICGAGNNAGDGYVVARLAAREGIRVTVTAVVDPSSLRGDAKTAFDEFAAGGGIAAPWRGTLDADADLLVDALLGSGLIRDVEGDFAACVSAINEHTAPVAALDIPTGLNGDTGDVMGCAVRADLTMTFVGLKSGLFLNDGPDHSGAIRFAGLGIPDSCRQRCRPTFRRIGDGMIRAALPRRPRTAHKGHHGHVLVVGGGAGMPGAARLCGEAALRAGAGLVSIATDASHAAAIAASRPELMPHGIQGAADLEPLLARADVVAFGPGLGRTPWAGKLFEMAATDERPAVWDADALNWLAASAFRKDNRVLTPHPGEAATLLGSSAAEIQSDRSSAVAALREKFGGTVVLKGAGTLVATDAEPPWLCSAGNPGMAAAGMGDVLTGIIAALMAQGLAPGEAAVIGVQVHARAGDRAARQGERGTLASDLVAAIRGIVNP